MIYIYNTKKGCKNHNKKTKPQLVKRKKGINANKMPHDSKDLKH